MLCPFETGETDEEIQVAFQSGRMDVLFNLVNEGKITIDYAAEFADLTMEEAEDMLFGWKQAQAGDVARR